MNIYDLHQKVLSHVDQMEIGYISESQIQEVLNTSWNQIFESLVKTSFEMPFELSQKFLYSTLGELIVNKIIDVQNLRDTDGNVVESSFVINDQETRKIIAFQIQNNTIKKQLVKLRDQDRYSIYNDPFRSPTLDDMGACYYSVIGNKYYIILPKNVTVNQIQATILEQAKYMPPILVITSGIYFQGKAICVDSVVYDEIKYPDGTIIENFNSANLDDGVCWAYQDTTILDKHIESSVSLTADVLTKKKQTLYTNNSNKN